VNRRPEYDVKGLGLHRDQADPLCWLVGNARTAKEILMNARPDHFPSETTGLAPARAPERHQLSNGDQFALRIAPVVKQVGAHAVRMLAYNGSIPGPTLRVRQGAGLTVNVMNEGDLEATVHWHGLRLENRYDGTAQTQVPMPIGGRFTYRLQFPDPGVYWYHPHIREDYCQEMGLYGNIVVTPTEPDYWPPAHREVPVTLDDVLLEDGRVAPFSRSESNYTAMGRFGTAFLVNGEPRLSLTAQRGEVIRFYLTDTANTRVFNVVAHGARMKLVGGDSGRYEREEFVENIVIAPSERVVVDVLFDTSGNATLEHRTPQRTHPLIAVTVTDKPASPPLAQQFGQLRINADMTVERERIAGYLDAEPDKTLLLVAEMNMGEPEVAPGTLLEYFCPMHAEVISQVPGKCPTCHMKLLAREGASRGFACPMHPDVRSKQPDRCPKCGMKLVPAQLITPPAKADHGHHQSEEGHVHAPGGIEWEDDMLEVNRMTTPANTRWKLIDQKTGAEGTSISWRFRVGDQVKIRLTNTMDSDHPMHHPFHIHGVGRFLILSRNGAVEPNLVWKDTVLVPTGQTVDLLLDVTNPGRWMAHCHIAEHHESGMMFSFDVVP
jgi:FtsP/CotA-like multicopper oxidase with cupredoxin domain